MIENLFRDTEYYLYQIVIAIFYNFYNLYQI